MGSHYPDSGGEVTWSDLCLKRILPAIALETDGEGDQSEANRTIQAGEGGGPSKGESGGGEVIDSAWWIRGWCEVRGGVSDDSEACAEHWKDGAPGDRGGGSCGVQEAEGSNAQSGKCPPDTSGGGKAGVGMSLDCRSRL